MLSVSSFSSQTYTVLTPHLWFYFCRLLASRKHSFLVRIIFKTLWHLTQSFLHTKILPIMLSHISWGTLNGTGWPKSQPAILDQTIIKLRISKLKAFSYKVQCSKDIIFTVITSTQTRVSVLHSHKFDKNMSFFVYWKIKNQTKNHHDPENKRSQYSQPLPTSHTMQRLHTYHGITWGQRISIHPHKFSCNGPYSNGIKNLNQNL